MDERYLVSTEWLAARLGRPELRVFDCTMALLPDPKTTYRVENRRNVWAEGHIPGSGYIDLAADLSDRHSRLRFMLAPVAQIVATLERLGVGNDTQVVVYSTAEMNWATRTWWVMRGVGVDRVAVLDGGFKKWMEEGRPVSQETCAYEGARFQPAPRPELMCDRDAVLAAIGKPDKVIINALTREQHAGKGVQYGRPGRITGSVNVPAREVVDAASGRFRSRDELRRLFDEAGVTPDREAMTYCGGGINAATTAFALAMLGHPGIRLYDASLQEWALDDRLPMERD
jgi:thiosulfate/3-mercaptopyruvate sulfurtransferase